jgi:hypothetical protein
VYSFISGHFGLAMTVALLASIVGNALQFMHVGQVKLQCNAAALKATVNAYTVANKRAAERQSKADALAIVDNDNDVAALSAIISRRNETIARLRNVKRDKEFVAADCRIDDRIVRDANLQLARARPR